MINLLPPSQKEELLEEKKLKLVLILGIVILGFLASLSLFLFAIKISVSSKLQIQKNLFDLKAEELQIAQNQELEGEIKSYNQILSRLDSFYKDGLDISNVLEKISSFLPEGVYLKSLDFDFSNNKILITGFSPTREKLLEFKKNLEKTNDFAEINFPTLNWVEEFNINFSASFKLDDNKEKN